MKYTGKLLKDMGKDHPLLPRLLAQHFSQNNQETAHLLVKLNRVYRRNPTWGHKFVQASNKTGGREFLGGFFIHWLAAFRIKTGFYKTTREAMDFQRKNGLFN